MLISWVRCAEGQIEQIHGLAGWFVWRGLGAIILWMCQMAKTPKAKMFTFVIGGMWVSNLECSVILIGLPCCCNIIHKLLLHRLASVCHPKHVQPASASLHTRPPAELHSHWVRGLQARRATKVTLVQWSWARQTEISPMMLLGIVFLIPRASHSGHWQGRDSIPGGPCLCFECTLWK